MSRKLRRIVSLTAAATGLALGVPLWAQAPAHAAGGACITGGFEFTDSAGARQPGQEFTVEVRRAGRTTVLASTTTGADGRFRVCVSEAQAAYDVDVHVVYSNPYWKVVSGRKGVYLTALASERDVVPGSDLDLGTMLPGSDQSMTAAGIFDSVRKAWDWVPDDCWDADDAVCRQKVVSWPNKSLTEEAASYNTRTDTVELDGPVQESTVIHELGHAIMDDVYEDDFPVPEDGCYSHQMNKAYGPICAWTEGWPTYFALTVLDTPIWTQADWDDDAEYGPGDRGWTWAEGEDAEIRVVAAMWDLADANNEAGESCTEDARGPLWRTFQAHRAETFRQYWAQRAADGYAVGSRELACLQHNTIDFSDVTAATADAGTTPKGHGRPALPPRRPRG
ncbi:hypothetical protein [Nocardioides sp. MH1]|uniref:hypothetical protein n=1 Tax=Nocardioides sp. MH1 TaxID=3242490 RepID=UPI0035209985